MIYEREFNAKSAVAAKNPKIKAVLSPPLSARGPGGDKVNSKNPWGNLEELKDKAKELICKYKIIRASKYSVAVKIRLNIEVDLLKEVFKEEVPVPVDPKAAAKKK